MQTIQKVSQDQDWLAIEEMDMELVLMKIMSSKHLHWSLEEAEDAILEYRKFLFLHKKYPKSAMAPTKAVDEIWHTHILFTKKYFADCESIFGSYFHHNPHVGNAVNLSEVQFATTKKLYLKTFGTQLGSEDRAESGGCSGGTTNCTTISCGG